MQARYYDPVIGRFYSNDPVDASTFISKGNVQGFNRYAYANNNPYKYVDLDGNNPRRVLFRFLKDPVRSLKDGVRTTKRFLERNGVIAPTPRPVENRDGRPDDVPMEDGNSTTSGQDSDNKHREQDTPFNGEPNSALEGKKRTREYGEDGKPKRDYDKPHQGQEEDHVHEWEDGKREHPGRPCSPLPKGQ